MIQISDLFYHEIPMILQAAISSSNCFISFSICFFRLLFRSLCTSCV